jgi:hypothetical protein
MLSRHIALPLAIALVLAGQGTAAHAHAGDHAHMTFAGLANHLLASLDHTSAIMAVVLAMALAGASALLARR